MMMMMPAETKCRCFEAVIDEILVVDMKIMVSKK